MDAGSGWTVAGDLPLADEVVLFGCFLGGYRETKATAGLFLWMDGGEIGLSGGALSTADAAVVFLFFFMPFLQ